MKARKKRAGSGFADGEVAAAFSQPIVIAQSDASRVIDALKLQVLQKKENKNTSAEYFDLSRRIDYLEEKGADVPSFMRTKMARLGTELEAFEEMMAARANNQSAGATSTSSRPAAGASRPPAATGTSQWEPYVNNRPHQYRDEDRDEVYNNNEGEFPAYDEDDEDDDGGGEGQDQDED
eukprot:1175917-Pleurochrysis_carterae.AAC.1